MANYTKEEFDFFKSCIKCMSNKDNQEHWLHNAKYNLISASVIDLDRYHAKIFLKIDPNLGQLIMAFCDAPIDKRYETLKKAYDYVSLRAEIK